MNGYYEYLPATFIYHDIDLHFVDTVIKNDGAMYTYEMSPTNKRFIKYTCGVSYLAAPFFLTAKLLCPILDEPVTGYSDPFEIATIISGIFYLVLGLIFVRKTLLTFFDDTVTSLTLIAVGISTNLFLYSTAQPLMAHVYSFFASAVFIYLIIQWHENANFLNSIFIGLTGGLLVLLRPVNILFVLVFLLYDVKSFSQVKWKFNLLIGHKIYLVIIILFAALVWIPQLLYWHHVSGQWLYFSYQQETFYFSHPYILKGLFGFRNGWLIYTPIMILIFPGIYFLRKTAPQFFIPVLFFVPLFITLILSWWCWWYVGFGNRAFVDAYALFSLPLAAAFHQIFSFKAAKFFAIVFIIFFSCLNLFQGWQMNYGILSYDSMTSGAYWAIFLKKQKPAGFDNLLEPPDYNGAKFKGRENAD